MTSAILLAQVAYVFSREADALLPDPYAYPPAPAASPEAAAEADRLNAIANELFVRADGEGFGADGHGNGTEAAFGYLHDKLRWQLARGSQ